MAQVSIPTDADPPQRTAYRLRNRFKQVRRIATRYEKRGINYLAMLYIGMILLWL